MDAEHCSECGEPTGRAGRGDDSIFVELVRDWCRPRGVTEAGTDVGPLCVECYHRLVEEGLVEA